MSTPRGIDLELSAALQIEYSANIQMDIKVHTQSRGS